MTTNYTTTVGITTANVTITDFTVVVTPPGSLGMNVYSAALNSDISVFDIGPTPDNSILLATLANGNHYVHDGVLHDSHTPSGPTFGTHGIYDKANGSLVERVEFYNHPNGQGYSARYPNRCKSCTFHDTPYCTAAFNYQDSIGPNGTLRIRDAIAYNLPSAGYFFYTDGLWRATDGTLLGDSLWKIEIDHATIDARGMTDFLNFGACHNQVYLTNSIIISDAGLPLAALITPPSDGSSVFLDNSIVMTSADAATYLGPAPTFTPVVVGGSPVINLAGASPPGCFAVWGNESDIGATQAGGGPPPPPPPPPPSPNTVVSLGVIGTGFSDGSDTIQIPVTLNVPRSDPSNGASIVIVYPFMFDASVSTVSDNAPTDPYYATHLYSDGLNPPYAHRAGVAPGYNGLILNPLEGGRDTITLQLTGPCSFGSAIAIAYTGVQVDNQVSPAFQVPDQPTLNWFDWLHIPSPFGEMGGNPFVAGSGNSRYLQWAWDVGGTVGILTPTNGVYPNWTIRQGELAVYFVLSTPFSTSPPGDFVPSDGAWTQLGALIDQPTNNPTYPNRTVSVWEKLVTAPETNGDLDGDFPAASTMLAADGTGESLIAGLGPIWATPLPPPPVGLPVFHVRFRSGD